MNYRVRFGAWSDASDVVTAPSPQAAIRTHARACKALHTGEAIEACATDEQGNRYEKIVVIGSQGQVTF